MQGIYNARNLDQSNRRLAGPKPQFCLANSNLWWLRQLNHADGGVENIFDDIVVLLTESTLDATVELHVVGVPFCHRTPFDDCSGIIQ